MAGKTGTAESFGKQDTPGSRPTHRHKPRYAVAVVVSQGGTGGAVAAAAARTIHDALRTLR